MSGPIEPTSGNERVTVPGHLMDRSGGDHYVLRVVGDNMTDEGVFDGDYVIVCKRDPIPGDMAVVLVGEDASLKRWYPEGATVRLQPANPCLQSIRVPARDVKVQGVVVGVMRKIEPIPPPEVPDAH